MCHLACALANLVVVAQGITGINIERGLKASKEGQSTHHMGGVTGSANLVKFSGGKLKPLLQAKSSI